MSESVRRVSLPNGEILSWTPEYDGIVNSYIREIASITGVTVERAIGPKIVLEGDVGVTMDSQIDVEDSGQALICQIESDDDPHFFVRLQSWDESVVEDGLQGDKFERSLAGHPTMNRLRGKRVRVTVEVISG